MIANVFIQLQMFNNRLPYKVVVSFVLSRSLKY